MMQIVHQSLKAVAKTRTTFRSPDRFLNRLEDIVGNFTIARCYVLA